MRVLLIVALLVVPRLASANDGETCQRIVHDFRRYAEPGDELTSRLATLSADCELLCDDGGLAGMTDEELHAQYERDVEAVMTALAAAREAASKREQPALERGCKGGDA